jgi:outer membrane protein assembly factor BamB
VPSRAGLIDIRAESGETRRTIPANAPTWLQIRAGRAYFVNGDGELAEVDLATGTELWSLKRYPENSAIGAVWGSPLTVAGDLLIYAQSNWLTALDRATKRRVWQAAFRDLALLGDELAFARIDLDQYAVFDLRNGRELWRQTFEIIVDPVFVGGLLFFRGEGSQLSAYDARTGQKHWALDVGTRAAPPRSGRGLRMASWKSR